MFNALTKCFSTCASSSVFVLGRKDDTPKGTDKDQDIRELKRRVETMESDSWESRSEDQV